MNIYDEELMSRMQNIRRPLIRTHPVTGDRALYINEKWLKEIVFEDRGEQATQYLDEIYHTLENYDGMISHSWTSGDLLIWDNCLVSHKAVPSKVGDTKTTWRVIVETFSE
ncbi:hypothetical protein ATY76_22450 [Rhizobium sp. R339]|nr:hypothetical protein ATY76_22450 [Rhizobium sp. R339]